MPQPERRNGQWVKGECCVRFTSYRRFLVLTQLLAGCTATTPVPPPASPPLIPLAKCEAMISNPLRGPDLRAIESIRRYPIEEVPPQFWSDIANSGLYSSEHRRWAVLQLFDRYAQPQWTLKEFGNLLASPTWLRQEEITYMDIPSGGAGGFPNLPFDIARGQSLIGIRVCLPTKDDSMIYLRMGARPDPKDIYATFMGNSSPADNIQVTEIAPFFLGAETIGGMDWRGGMESPWQQSVDLGKSNPNAGE